jgi:aromatic ring-opening dioxygenase catalytic subunit (LigB family)
MRKSAPSMETLESSYSAIVFVSAHQQTRGGFAVTSGRSPRGGPASSPELALSIQKRLQDGGIACEVSSTAPVHDDVVYGPLNVMWPDLGAGRSKLPVLSMSIECSLNGELHTRAGKLLAALAAGFDGKKPVLFVGSGHTSAYQGSHHAHHSAARHNAT